MSLIKKTLTCVLCIATLMNANVYADSKPVDDGSALMGVGATGVVGNAIFSLTAGESTASVDARGALTKPVSMESYLRQQLIGATVTYEEVRNGKAVSISRVLATSEDVAKFDAIRVKAVNAARMKGLNAVTKSIRVGNAIMITVGAASLAVFAAGAVMHTRQTTEGNSATDLELVPVEK